MGEIFKLGLICITVVMIAMQIRSYSPVFGVIMVTAVSVYLLIRGIDVLKDLSDSLEFVGSLMGQYSGYIKILYKIVGITYICEFTANICKETGFLSLANQVIIAGKFIILTMGFPIVCEVIEEIRLVIG